MVGLQREQSSPDGGPSPLGGIRTYPLVALTGAVAMLLAGTVGPWIVLAGFAAVMVLIGLAYADDLRRGLDRGITSEIAMLLIYLIGALCLAREMLQPWKTRMLVSAGTGVAVMGLLSLKHPLHDLARRVSKEDIYATLRFALVGVILLPLLPNRAYGPMQVLNPFHIGTMIVLIAGISFLGYVAIRVLGPGRGLGVTGLLGGLVSSTAVTLSFSGRAKNEPAVAGACATGVVLACSIMPIRVIAEVAVVNPGLVRTVAIPMGAVAAAGLLSAGALFLASRKQKAAAEQVKVANPFQLSSAVKFGLLFAAVLFVSKAATLHFGAAGIYLAGLLAGTTDVDAITLSMAKLSREGLDPNRAATTILIAAASNTVVKGSLAVSLGGWAFGRRVIGAFAGMLAAGGAGLAALWAF